ncbi:MAG TPA: rubredoxin [Chitinophagaceae bacterium]|nr:rubredoxin [Chitinophagaceae bacterium]
MRHAFQCKVNFRGGIISPGYLYALLETLEAAGLHEVRFGLRQQLLIDVAAKEYSQVTAQLDAAGIDYEINKDSFPNITSAYPAAAIFTKDSWLGEGVYKDIFDLFTYPPSLKVNITDNNQTFTPLFTGHINWIASSHTHFWWLVIRFPSTNLLYYWKDLVYTNDIARLSKAVEEAILQSPSLYIHNVNANGQALNNKVMAAANYMTMPAAGSLHLPAFVLPYYEGFNQYGDKWWLGIYRREEMFTIAFLKDICRACLDTKAGELYTTPWKSIIIKGIEEKHRPRWTSILSRHRINVRHASNELNWQVEDGNNEGLAIKRLVIRQFDKEDVRTFGLCFAVQTHPTSGVFGSVLIRRQFASIRGSIKPLEKYDLLYTAGFNPNAKELILFRANVKKEHIATYLVALTKYYYEQEDRSALLPGSAYDVLPVQEIPVVKPPIVQQCRHCLTVYDERLGEPAQGILPGTAFEMLKEDFHCALCEGPKEDFLPVPANFYTLQTA